MLSEKELRQIAKDTVRNMNIKTIPNPGIKKARAKYRAFVSKILRLKQFSKKQLSDKELKIVKKLKDLEYGPLVLEKNGRFSVKERVGETVRLIYSNVDEECLRLARFIMEECWKAGIHVFGQPYSSEESRRHLELSPDDAVAELPFVSKLMAGAFDARIFLGGDEDINWIKGLEEKTKMGAPAAEKVHEIMDRKGVRWCYFGWPIPKKQYFVSKGIYRRLFLDSIKETFTPRVKKLCEYYRKSLDKGDVVRITANDGTDLTFRIKGRPVLVADGILDDEDVKKGDIGLNIPDGETFLAPLEDSANGTILFDYVVVHGFGFVKKLKMKFKDGKVVWFSSPQKKIFKKFLDSNTGEKNRIAELGIGTNPAAGFTGETIVDEKIFGSIHIAIGNNTGAYHGKNKASSHQDMIKIMKRRNGNVYVDGKLIMKNGIPVGLK